MLRISDISLENFRSYGRLDLHGLDELTIFVGPNASGKTNVIEAIQMLTALSSFRAAKAAELVKHGESHGRAQIHMSDGVRELDLALVLEAAGEGNAPHVLSQPDATELPTSAQSFPMTRMTRRYIYNGKKRSTKDLRGLLPSVAFTPDDLNLAKGSNRFRRRELDMLGSQVNANYFQLVRDYEKVLRQKNRLLKDEAPMDMVEAADVVFQKVALQLTSYRRSLFDRLLPGIAQHYGQIAANGEALTAAYFEHRDGEDGHSAPSLSAEAAAHRAIAGPHLHSIHFYIDGMDVQTYASQGQQRSVVLATKLAEAELVEEMLDQLPVLLLDDVMSELDGARRQALVQELLEGKQTFITTANIDYFDSEMLSRANVVKLGE